MQPNVPQFAHHGACAVTIDHRSGRRLDGAPVAAMRRVQRPSPDSRRPNYGVRRAGAISVVAMALFVGAQMIGAAGSFFESTPAFADGGPVPSSEVVRSGVAGPVHVARAGDTLWGIAEAHRGDVSRDDFIDALVALNGDVTIQVGQAVRLPRS